MPIELEGLRQNPFWNNKVNQSSFKIIDKDGNVIEDEELTNIVERKLNPQARQNINPTVLNIPSEEKRQQTTPFIQTPFTTNLMIGAKTPEQQAFGLGQSAKFLAGLNKGIYGEDLSGEARKRYKTNLIGNIVTNAAGLGFGLIGNALAGTGQANVAMTQFKDYNEQLAKQSKKFDATAPTSYMGTSYFEEGGKYDEYKNKMPKKYEDGGNYNAIVEQGETGVVGGKITGFQGKAHASDGFKGEGAMLKEGDKIISNSIIPSKESLKIIKDYFGKIAKDKTYADVHKKIINPLNKEKEEQEKLFEKLKKNEVIKDENTKKRNEEFYSKEINKKQEKIDELNNLFKGATEFIFKLQEKDKAKEQEGDIKLKRKTVREENLTKEIEPILSGRVAPTTPVEETEGQMMKDGGKVSGKIKTLIKEGYPQKQAVAIALDMEKRGELQDGGEQDQMAQIVNAVAQSLQQGEAPETILQQLIEAGVDEQSAQQIIQNVMAQMQQPQEEMAMQQEATMQNGGEINDDPLNNLLQEIMSLKQQGVPDEQINNYLLEQGLPQEQIDMIMSEMTEAPMMQDGDGYTFQTMFNNEFIDPKYITKESPLTVETIQSRVGEKGYGKNVQDIEAFINAHDWYFTDEKKKLQFKQAVAKGGKQQAVKDFQSSYNKELEKRATEAGLGKEQIETIKKEYGFDETGKERVKAIDGLFGGFTSSRPIGTFKKEAPKQEPQTVSITTPETEEKVEEKKTQETPTTPFVPTQTSTNRFNQFTRVKPTLPPTALQTPPLFVPQTQEVQPVKISDEAAQREIGRIGQQAIQATQQNVGAQQQANIANIFGRMSDKSADIRSQTEAQNAQAKLQVDFQNAQARNIQSQNLANALTNYVAGTQRAVDITNQDIRNYYDDIWSQRLGAFKENAEMNLVANMFANYTIDPLTGQLKFKETNNQLPQQNTFLNSILAQQTPTK